MKKLTTVITGIFALTLAGGIFSCSEPIEKQSNSGTKTSQSQNGQTQTETDSGATQTPSEPSPPPPRTSRTLQLKNSEHLLSG